MSKFIEATTETDCKWYINIDFIQAVGSPYGDTRIYVGAGSDDFFGVVEPVDEIMRRIREIEQ